MQSETAYIFVEIGHIPVTEKRVLNAGHRLHESWPVDKGKYFTRELVYCYLESVAL